MDRASILHISTINVTPHNPQRVTVNVKEFYKNTQYLLNSEIIVILRPISSDT